MSKVLDKINYWASPYVWKKTPAEKLDTLWEHTLKPYYDHEPNVSEPLIKESFVRDNRKWDHEEYIKEIKGSFLIDPKSGFLIDVTGRIVQESIVFDHFGIYPDKVKLRHTHAKTNLPEVVLFDHFWSANYFHFYSDVLAKLFLMGEKAPGLKSLPLIVSHKISQTKQFRFFMQFKEVANHNWYIQQPGEIICTQKAYLLQPQPYDSRNWQRVKSITTAYHKPLIPGKKLFINRSEQTGRCIENFEEIRPLLIAAGFEIVEMEGKTLEEQIGLFSSASVIASIHGAALANMVYCHKSCQIIEIMAEKMIHSHYYWLSQSLGLAGYECLLGSELKKNRLFYPKGRFLLDPVKTSICLEAISLI